MKIVLFNEPVNYRDNIALIIDSSAILEQYWQEKREAFGECFVVPLHFLLQILRALTRD